MRREVDSSTAAESIGTVVYDLRKRLGMTQEAFAGAVRTTRNTIVRLESSPASWAPREGTCTCVREYLEQPPSQVTREKKLTPQEAAVFRERFNVACAARGRGPLKGQPAGAATQRASDSEAANGGGLQLTTAELADLREEIVALRAEIAALREELAAMGGQRTSR